MGDIIKVNRILDPPSFYSDLPKMSSSYIQRRYGDQAETRARSTVRSSSVALDSRARATSQTIDAQEIAISRLRSPSAVPSKRWSSILEHGNESYQPRSRPPLPPTANMT